MKKWAIVTLVLVLTTSIIPAFAQLPPEVMKKVLAAENPRPATENKRQWFFLMAGGAAGFSTNVFMVAGPFKNLTDCNQVSAWAKEERATASRCWDGGN